MKLQFLGAAGTVTGSKYLVQHKRANILVDCGLFQGIKRLRERNRAPFPFDIHHLDAILLTHAHLDHSGYLPALAKAGYRGPVYCTPGTLELCKILLLDAAHLQEEDADYANRKGFSRHHPAEPLYTTKDAEAALKLLRPLGWHEHQQIVPDMRLSYQHAGHIIGAASVYLETDTGTLAFSGDIGRPHDPLMLPPEPLQACDWLVTESTYGDQQHPDIDVESLLAKTISRCAAHGGVTLLPAFAVGRAQLALHLLLKLRDQGRIPEVPIFLNSPMASKATQVLLRFPDEHRLSMADCRAIEERVICIESVEESIALNQRRGPHIIVSASGMATGGRVLHHLRKLLPNPRNQIIFMGFQSPGTRGDAMVRGMPEIKIFGEYVPVSAPVLKIDALSAHADQPELMGWLRTAPTAPRQVFLTHGEPVAADSLRLQLKDQLGWASMAPEAMERVVLS